MCVGEVPVCGASCLPTGEVTTRPCICMRLCDCSSKRCRGGIKTLRISLVLSIAAYVTLMVKSRLEMHEGAFWCASQGRALFDSDGFLYPRGRKKRLSGSIKLQVDQERERERETHNVFLSGLTHGSPTPGPRLGWNRAAEKK